VTRAPAVTRLPAEALPGAVAEWLAERLAASIAAQGTCAIALAGGRTPQSAYEALAAPPFATAVDWAHVDVYFGDERAVPADAPESNFRMAREALLRHVPLPPERIHRMTAERADLDRACRDYERLLPPRLDVLLLGMGPDGHTASLFARSAALTERNRRVVPATAPAPPATRMTITPPVIAAARNVAVLVAGAAKAQMVARALRGPHAPLDVPVQLAEGAHWFLDEAAAALLGGPSGEPTSSRPAS
jgi:6-phosphogluconolactonase